MDPKEVDSWTASIVEDFGRLDGAANIAGGEKHDKRKAEDKTAELVRTVAARRGTHTRARQRLTHKPFFSTAAR